MVEQQEIGKQSRRPLSRQQSKNEMQFSRTHISSRQLPIEVNRNTSIIFLIIVGDDLLADQLPRKSELEKVQKRKDDNCNLCFKPLGFLKSQRHNCYSCGACVCEKCSENKIQLSKDDSTLYRVCNYCFSIKSNKKIIVFYKEMDKAK